MIDRLDNPRITLGALYYPDEGVVVDDLEASEARAMSMPSDDGTESSAISRSGADMDVQPLAC